MTTLLLSLVLGQIGVPSLPPAEAALRAASRANVKSLGFAALRYAADHHDRFPPARGFQAAITPYLRDRTAFTAPGDPKGTVSYFLDPRVSGLKLSEIAQPAQTALIVQGRNGKAVFPYAGQTPLGYADGHVKMANPSKVRQARSISLK